VEFFKTTPRIGFMAMRNWCYAISAVLIVGSFLAIGIRGMNFGIDFTGGVVLEISNPSGLDEQRVRDTLANAGFDAQVQALGGARELMVRVLPEEGEQDTNKVGSAIVEVLRAIDPAIELRRADVVGPQVGDELAEQGGLAMLFSLIGILIYMSFRFQWKLSAGTVIAAVHDPIVIVGVFALFQLPFDLAVLAAILAVVGYSINDTVVVFDRVREVFHTKRRATTAEMLDLALNQTLSRTLMTSFSTLFVVGSLYVFGGEALKGFSLAIIIGVVVGTYSSIFISAALVLDMKLTPADLMPAEKETSEVDALP
jgi:preprotein translocase subunit SecF